MELVALQEQAELGYSGTRELMEHQEQLVLLEALEQVVLQEQE